ncbi:MAG TPA: GNAT family N-acetyltransferase [Bacteroidia bacterium]|nr:GNAT family N-acetyltransferase [Bacteroidia bacterium]
MSKDVIIKRLGKKDIVLFKNLISLFNEVFEIKKHKSAKKSYLQKVLKESSFISIVAICDDKIVGGLTAYELPMYYSKYSEVLIYDMAVLTEFQRKGIGKKLISALKKYCRKKGIQYIFVPANEEDAHALAFYTSTGGKPEKVVHFNYNAN